MNAACVRNFLSTKWNILPLETVKTRVSLISIVHQRQGRRCNPPPLLLGSSVLTDMGTLVTTEGILALLRSIMTGRLAFPTSLGV